MPPKYSLEQKVDALVSTTSNLTEALEIQNELRLEFVRSVLDAISKSKAGTVGELAMVQGVLLAIGAELQRLKLVPPPGAGGTDAGPDDVLVVKIPAIRLSRATAAKALAWVWSKIRAPVLVALLGVLTWLAARAGLQWPR